MAERYDVIVVGLGGFGSAAACELAGRGVSVLGLEQFDLAHSLGSSHGETRIIRRAYFEHPDYVPLLDDTYRLWRELEAETGADLMDLCGLVLAGPADGEAIPGVRLARDLHGVSIEELDHKAAARQFPQIRFADHHVILGERDAGYLRVDDCVRTHCELAARRGAVLRSSERVEHWESAGETVTVRTDKQTYEANRLVIAAGAWAQRVIADLQIPLTVIRKPVLWFSKTLGSHFDWPVFYIEDAGRSFYGLPGLDQATVKIAEHSGGDSVDDPNAVSQELSAVDANPISDFAKTWLREVDPLPVRHSVCMYTMSPDGHFLLDRHPVFDNVVVAAGFSGHGFKFTPVLARAIADLALAGQTELPVGFLSLDRF